MVVAEAPGDRSAVMAPKSDLAKDTAIHLSGTCFTLAFWGKCSKPSETNRVLANTYDYTSTSHQVLTLVLAHCLLDRSLSLREASV